MIHFTYRDSILEELRRELLRGVDGNIVLAGDGRMDSHGHSAQILHILTDGL